MTAFASRGAQTGLVALLGHPVSHSVSPALHNAAFAAAGLDLHYMAFDVAPDQLPTAVAGLRALQLAGANITVPHKTAALELADDRTEEAVLVGAANTLFWRDGALVADNTDAAALGDVLDRDVAADVADGVVLFGAGGAARAAAVALGRRGAVVEVVARRPEAAAEIGRLVVACGGTEGAVTRPRIVVNATTLGLRGEALPDRFMRLDADQVALDVVYGPVDTPFVAAARRAGAAAVDGRGMLVAQAERAFRRWTGSTPPAGAMVAAAARALGGA